MRELKFRVWDKRRNKFLNSKDIVIRLNGEVAGIHGGSGTVKEWILNQYTGLKDKNGKEIYEWDIVDLGQTVNGCNIFIVIWDEEKIGWNVRYGIKMNCPRNYEYSVSEFFEIDKLTGDGVKVIGDIYNNPELLK